MSNSDDPQRTPHDSHTPRSPDPEGAPEPDQGEKDPLIGTLLRNKWRVLERVGSGGFGTVYKVQDVKGGWIEALKILGVSRTTGAEADTIRRRFLREAQIMKSLGAQSQHIVGLSTYEEDLEAGLVYFLMELVEGRSLADALAQDGPFGPERTLHMALQLCDALIVAHEAEEEVVHRDLKLENVMLTRNKAGEEMAKVLDFGIAKITEGEVDSRLTSVGTSLGTPGFAAPEQLRAEKVDGRTDLFALGVILYCLLTGRDPWYGRNAWDPTDQVFDLMVATERAEVIPFEKTGVVPPPELSQVVIRLLQRDPDARFQSVRELKTVLTRISRERDAEEPRAPTPAFSAAEPGSALHRRSVKIALAGVFLLLAGGLMILRPWASTPGVDQEVARLIRQATAAQSEMRYFGQPGMDVRTFAEEAILVEPENPEARSLLLKVAERMAWDADAALEDGSPERARELARECLRMAPEHSGCVAVMEELR